MNALAEELSALMERHGVKVTANRLLIARALVGKPAILIFDASRNSSA